MKQEILSKSPKQTKEIASDFIKKIIKRPPFKEGALVFSLEGELGAGKTQFLKGIGKALKIREKINSPTFVIMKRYPLKRKDFKYLWHLDLYRLKKTKEITNLGFKDLLKDKKNLIFIEWGNKIKKILPKNYLRIKIKIKGEKERILEISSKINSYKNL